MKKNLRTQASALIAIVIFYFIIELFGVTCPIKFITGISCAGCGMSRAWLALFRLDFQQAFYFHPLFWLPPLFIIVYFFKNHINTKVYKILIFTMIFICAIVYLYRLIMGNNDIVVFQPENNILFRIIKQYFI